MLFFLTREEAHSMQVVVFVVCLFFRSARKRTQRRFLQGITQCVGGTIGAIDSARIEVQPSVVGVFLTQGRRVPFVCFSGRAEHPTRAAYYSAVAFHPFVKYTTIAKVQ